MRLICKFLSMPFLSIALLFAAASPVHASDVSSVKTMLTQAAESEDKASFETILKMALTAWPDKKADILAAAEGVKADWLALSQQDELKQIRQDEKDAEAASRARGIIYYLDPVLWNAQAELGAGNSTGDTKETAVSIGLTFDRKFGDNWEHALDLDFDYARSEGETTRQKFVAEYEALWRIHENLYATNYTEVELDKFSGYDYRILETLGLGVKVFENDLHGLRVSGGPGMRFSKLKLTEETDSEFLGRVSATYRLKLSETISFRDRLSLVYGATSTTVSNSAAFAAKLNSHLTARLSYDVTYDSEPPLGTAAWDTSTRITFVYGF